MGLGSEAGAFINLTVYIGFLHPYYSQAMFSHGGQSAKEPVRGTVFTGSLVGLSLLVH